MDRSTYIPALGFASLTRFYDRVLAATMKQEKFKSQLVRQAAPRPGHRVLDLGCGTATLTILLKDECPEATVLGIDADAEVLEIGREKAHERGAQVELRQAMADDLPFESQSFDRVVSSLLLHHLTLSTKRRALSSVYEVLKPGGEIHIADWGRAQNPLMRAAYLGIQLLDGFETTGDNVRGRIPELMRSAGFEDAHETHHEMTVFGTLSLYRGTRPAERLEG